MFDLRNSLEIDAHGAGLLAETGTVRKHLPITSRSSQTAVVDGVQAALSSLRTPDEMLAVSLGMLEASSSLFVEAVETLARYESLPAVFFCTAGKDRTGVLSAVLLGALGVRDEDLIEDYFLTREAIELIIGRLASTPGSPDMYRDLPAVHFAPYEETMERFISEVRRLYGSFDDYLLQKGLSPGALASFRTSLLDA